MYYIRRDLSLTLYGIPCN